MKARAIAVCVALVALAVPINAPASDAPGCGGAWSTRAACTFDPDALPLRVFADVEGQGLVRVSVSITTRETFGNVAVPIWQCSAIGMGSASCDRAIGPLQPVYGPETPLRCLVEGSGAGQYYCSYPPSNG